MTALLHRKAAPISPYQSIRAGTEICSILMGKPGIRISHDSGGHNKAGLRVGRKNLRIGRKIPKAGNGLLRYNIH